MAYMIYNQLGIKIRGADGNFHDFQGVMQIDKNIVNVIFEDDSKMTVSRRSQILYRRQRNLC